MIISSATFRLIFALVDFREYPDFLIRAINPPAHLTADGLGMTYMRNPVVEARVNDAGYDSDDFYFTAPFERPCLVELRDG